MPKSKRKNISSEYDSLLSAVQDGHLELKSNEDLFTIDSVGSGRNSKRLTSPKTIGSNGVRIRNKLSKKKRSFQSQPEVEKLGYDIWNTEGVAFRSSRVHKLDRIAPPGLSYNPSLSDHQDILAEATALEIKHRDSIAHDTITSQELDTSAIPEFDECAPSSDELESSIIAHQQTKPLTKAKKNRKRAVAIAEYNRYRKRSEVTILKEISNIAEISRKVQSEESKQEMKRKIRSVLQKNLLDQSALSYREAGLIPLSDELNGTLRAIIPKGSRLKDQVMSMISCGNATEVGWRKRRAYEKPHGARNIKWYSQFK